MPSHNKEVPLRRSIVHVSPPTLRLHKTHRSHESHASLFPTEPPLSVILCLMPTTRRTFIQSTLAAGALATLGRNAAAQPKPAPTAPKPVRILILGGTNFLGPAIVEDAQKRGYHLTLFNRGTREKTKG